MEASSKPHLHLVDSNGQATAICADCVQYERDLKGKRLRIAQLEAALAEQQGTADDAPAIRMVLDDWSQVALTSGWWGRLPRYKPADGRWKATKAAMNRDYDATYLIAATRGAFMAAAPQRKDPRFSRAWLQPQTIYGGNLESHYEFAMDPERQWVKAALEVPTALRDRWTQVLDLADPCDCGHIRLDHQKPALTVDDRLTFGDCLVHGCHCDGFDKDWWREEKFARWAARQELPR